MRGKVIVFGGRRQGRTAAEKLGEQIISRGLRLTSKGLETLAEMLAFHRVERDAQSLGAAMHALERAWADPVIGKRSMGEALAAKRWELLRIPGV